MTGYYPKDGGRTLLLVHQVKGCESYSANAVESASAVSVSVKAVSLAASGRMCPMYVGTGSTAVKLAKPLGTRAVYDDGHRVPVANVSPPMGNPGPVR